MIQGDNEPMDMNTSESTDATVKSDRAFLVFTGSRGGMVDSTGVLMVDNSNDIEEHQRYGVRESVLFFLFVSFIIQYPGSVCT